MCHLVIEINLEVGDDLHDERERLTALGAACDSDEKLLAGKRESSWLMRNATSSFRST